jgi:hypothetical protein
VGCGLAFFGRSYPDHPAGPQRRAGGRARRRQRRLGTREARHDVDVSRVPADVHAVRGRREPPATSAGASTIRPSVVARGSPE